MIELLATIIITVSSIVLFAYWFRYTCLLILSAKTSRDYAGGVAAKNKLSFLEVQSQLENDNSADLDQLRDSLDRDYRIITSLLKYSTNASEGQTALESRMLAINYRLMGGWYSLTRNLSDQIARRALEEMSMVVAHFANAMGERTAASMAA